MKKFFMVTAFFLANSASAGNFSDLLKSLIVPRRFAAEEAVKNPAIGERLFDEILSKDPSDPVALYNFGSLKLSKGDPKAAEIYLRAALEEVKKGRSGEQGLDLPKLGRIKFNLASAVHSSSVIEAAPLAKELREIESELSKKEGDEKAQKDILNRYREKAAARDRLIERLKEAEELYKESVSDIENRDAAFDNIKKVETIIAILQGQKLPDNKQHNKQQQKQNQQNRQGENSGDSGKQGDKKEEQQQSSSGERKNKDGEQGNQSRQNDSRQEEGDGKGGKNEGKNQEKSPEKKKKNEKDNSEQKKRKTEGKENEQTRGDANRQKNKNSQDKKQGGDGKSTERKDEQRDSEDGKGRQPQEQAPKTRGHNGSGEKKQKMRAGISPRIERLLNAISREDAKKMRADKSEERFVSGRNDDEHTW